MNIEYEKENLNSVLTRHCPSYNMFCTCFCVGWWCTEEQKHKQRRNNRSDNVAPVFVRRLTRWRASWWRLKEAEVDAVSSYQPICMWLLRRSLWVQQVNMMFVSGLLSYQPVWMSFFSRGGLKQSLWTGSVHFLRRPTVITWLSVPCVRDVISLICLFLSQERRGGDLCRSVSPLLLSGFHRETYCLCCTVIYSHWCCRQPLPLLSLPLCTDSQVSLLPW